jgi:hypothetical protein
LRALVGLGSSVRHHLCSALAFWYEKIKLLLDAEIIDEACGVCQKTEAPIFKKFLVMLFIILLFAATASVAAGIPSRVVQLLFTL